MFIFQIFLLLIVYFIIFLIVKRKFDDSDCPMELVINDISKRLKLVILHDDEAAKLTLEAKKSSQEFYSLSGDAIIGPYPKVKGICYFFRNYNFFTNSIL